MKKGHGVFGSLLAGFLTVSFAGTAYAHEIPTAKAAELALHRIERLVVLKKIEDAFQSKLKNLSFEMLITQKPTDPLFKIVASQYPNSNGTQRKVELLLDEDGKALQHFVSRGGEAEGAPNWSEKDPVTLAEVALHLIVEQSKDKPELAVFESALSELSITQETNADGTVVAVFTAKAAGSASLLKIRIKGDGSVESYEIVSKEEPVSCPAQSAPPASETDAEPGATT